MRLLYLFWNCLKYWLGRDCDHLSANVYGKNTFCPDCGHKVKLVWYFIQCQQCSSKRPPQPGILGPIRPKTPFCVHCGSLHFRLIQKSQIHPQELPFAVSKKELDFEQPSPWTHRQQEEAFNPKLHHPSFFYDHPLYDPDIVDGEVLRRQYVYAQQTPVSDAAFYLSRGPETTQATETNNVSARRKKA
ncbi:MAG: hypothetical protein K2X01_10860 [Cyanobacteria bacterium]|nr:hypothetical protein [Cyanobacteriota bacterium]